MHIEVWVIVAALITLSATAVILRNKKGPRQRQAAPEITVAAPATVVAEVLPDRIGIGQTPSAPLVTMATYSDLAAFEQATPIDAHSSKPVSTLSALMQAVPALLVAGEAQGKNLMEVVINGDLVRAANGDGLRAFAMNGGKISEHAKLFEVDKLQNMINAAAIWQIASVVVAQKHLADISQKLDEIKEGVNHLSRFLDNQRKARIKGTYEYLGQVYMAIKGGDLPDAARTELENCERDLLEIQHHLEMEFKQKVDKRVEHKETFGTEDLTNDIGSKIADLEMLAEDINLCMKTRIAAWHVLSLFPGDPNLKISRKQSIESAIATFAELKVPFKDALHSEIDKINSFWNKGSTLQARKDSLQSKCSASARKLESHAQSGRANISQSESLLLTHDQPSRLLIQVENGQLVDARQMR